MMTWSAWKSTRNLSSTDIAILGNIDVDIGTSGADRMDWA